MEQTDRQKDGPGSDSGERLTIVLGASPNPARASHTAVRKMVAQEVPVIPVGIRKGEIAGVPIRHELPTPGQVHTVTLYLNPRRQKEYYDYILELNPERIIFNPGTENPELIQMARERGIQADLSCTLVLLSMGAY